MLRAAQPAGSLHADSAAVLVARTCVDKCRCMVQVEERPRLLSAAAVRVCGSSSSSKAMADARGNNGG
jgi:hypothetical protein